MIGLQALFTGDLSLCLALYGLPSNTGGDSHRLPGVPNAPQTLNISVNIYWLDTALQYKSYN